MKLQYLYQTIIEEQTDFRNIKFDQLKQYNSIAHEFDYISIAGFRQTGKTESIALMFNHKEDLYIGHNSNCVNEFYKRLKDKNRITAFNNLCYLNFNSLKKELGILYKIKALNDLSKQFPDISSEAHNIFSKMNDYDKYPEALNKIRGRTFKRVFFDVGNIDSHNEVNYLIYLFRSIFRNEDVTYIVF